MEVVGDRRNLSAIKGFGDGSSSDEESLELVRYRQSADADNHSNGVPDALVKHGRENARSGINVGPVIPL